MARTYTVPDFNLVCNVWKGELTTRIDSWPFTGPGRAADLTPICQLYIAGSSGANENRVSVSPFTNYFGNQGPGIELRLPIGTPVTHPYGLFTGATFDLVELPAGSGVYYVVYLALDRHKGFPNEYRLAYLAPAFRWGAEEDAARWETARGFGAGRGTA